MGIQIEDRQGFLAGLDRVERAVVGIYRAFLALVILAIGGGTAWVVIKRPWGAGHQGEWFYFSIAVLLALGWAVGQYVALGRRRQLFGLPLTIRAKHDGNSAGRELKFGGSSESRGDSGTEADGVHLDLSHGFQIPLGALARDVLPDAATIERLRVELATGSDLDEACRTVQPAYADWNKLTRWAYRTYAAGLIEQQRGTKLEDGDIDPRADDARW